MYKDRIRNAMGRFEKRYAPKGPPKKNKKPEKEAVQLVKSWLERSQFSVSVVEAKAVYSEARRAYLRGQVEPGFPDIVGCDRQGTAAFIEVKAKNRKFTAKPHQIAFLREKIALGCFGCVTDCPEHLALLYEGWLKARQVSKELAVQFLLKNLPQKKTHNNTQLFDSID